MTKDNDELMQHIETLWGFFQVDNDNEINEFSWEKTNLETCDTGETVYRLSLTLKQINQARACIGYIKNNTCPTPTQPSADMPDALEKLRKYARSTSDNIPYHHFDKIDALVNEIRADLSQPKGDVELARISQQIGREMDSALARKIGNQMLDACNTAEKDRLGYLKDYCDIAHQALQLQKAVDDVNTRTQAIVELLEGMKKEAWITPDRGDIYNQALDDAIKAIKDMK